MASPWGAGFYFVLAGGDPMYRCMRSFCLGCVFFRSGCFRFFNSVFAKSSPFFALEISMASFSDVPGVISPGYAAGFSPSVLWPLSVAWQLTCSPTVQPSRQAAHLTLWASFGGIPQYWPPQVPVTPLSSSFSGVSSHALQVLPPSVVTLWCDCVGLWSDCGYTAASSPKHFMIVGGGPSAWRHPADTAAVTLCL